MLRAEAHHLIVTPTGDNSEEERGRLIVVNQPEGTPRVYRGVIEDVGSHMSDGSLEPGCVAHYTGFWPVGDRHVVPAQHFIAWDDNDDR